MKDAIVISVLVLVLGLAIYAIYRSKKSGKRCIGCPDSGSCSGSCGNCSCNCGNKK
ncbi:MAG: FeoB-associated Cys-rich membrane protein [Oscillospiraceae bacterium]|nr:FeoB-associated Cys-rich membrane protein [Oscillospiraceae bacterium]